VAGVEGLRGKLEGRLPGGVENSSCGGGRRSGEKRTFVAPRPWGGGKGTVVNDFFGFLGGIVLVTGGNRPEC